MITLTQLQKFLNQLLVYNPKLNLAEIDPYMANGLMVKGEETINKIGLAVSASVEVFKKAKKANCQALIVHHAFNYPPTTRYDALFQNRYSYLIKNDLSLFGYHFLLDSHPRLGHNVNIIQLLKGKVSKPFLHKNQPWGYFGKLSSLSLDDAIALLRPKLSPQMYIYRFGPKIIKKVVAVSGRGTPLPSDIQYLLDNSVDLFITGETSEWVRDIFREIKINFIAGGHYHTERFGLLSLKQQIDKNLKVKTEFIEFENVV